MIADVLKTDLKYLGLVLLIFAVAFYLIYSNYNVVFGALKYFAKQII